MFVARNFDSTLVLFNNKPVRPDGWVKWVDILEDGTEDFGKVLTDEYYYPELKPYDEPVEVILLPVPTEETLHSNPVYHSIIDYGRDLRDTEICAKVWGENYRHPHNCKHYGHPWCSEGCYCANCEEWSYDIENLINFVKSVYKNEKR